MTRRTALIKASTLVGFDDLARRSGADADWLLASVGLPDIYLRQPELYLPFLDFVRLLEISARETRRPLFGAELGFHQGIRVYGMIAQVLATSPTIGIALERMLDHYRLQTTGMRLRLDRLERSAVLSADVIAPVPASAHQIHGQLAAAGIAIMRTFAGPNWAPDEVHFPFPVPASQLKPYHQLFGEAARFEAARTALIFDMAVLDIPLPEADPALHALIEHQLGTLALRFAEDLPLQVEAAIQNHLPSGTASVAGVARALAMSPRSLQRHLAGTGTSFQQLLDDTRRKTAEHYLRDTDLPLAEIAELLGYQALSNLSHAFRRWHQTSPRDWRQAQA